MCDFMCRHVAEFSLSFLQKMLSFCAHILYVCEYISLKMHTKIHTATSVLCIHFQFSFHLDVEVTHALSTRKALFFGVFSTSILVQIYSIFGPILVQISHNLPLLKALFFHSFSTLLALSSL